MIGDRLGGISIVKGSCRPRRIERQQAPAVFALTKRLDGSKDVKPLPSEYRVRNKLGESDYPLYAGGAEELSAPISPRI